MTSALTFWGNLKSSIDQLSHAPLDNDLHGFAQKVVLSVRVSGRPIIAQQFTAGINERRAQSVKRTAECNGQISALFSRPFHGLRPMFAPLPAINRWAIIGRPLTRTGPGILFV